MYKFSKKNSISNEICLTGHVDVFALCMCGREWLYSVSGGWPYTFNRQVLRDGVDLRHMSVQGTATARQLHA